MQAIETKVTKKRGRPVERLIDLQKALSLRLKGNSFADIGKVFGVSKQAVEQRLSSFLSLLKDTESVRAYEAGDNKASLLSAAEFKLLQHIVDNETIEKASLNNAAYAYDKIFEANRISRDLSTANMQVRMVFHVVREGEADGNDSAIEADNGGERYAT